jgi:hypothetical protein
MGITVRSVRYYRTPTYQRRVKKARNLGKKKVIRARLKVRKRAETKAKMIHRMDLVTEQIKRRGLQVVNQINLQKAGIIMTKMILRTRYQMRSGLERLKA